YIRRHPYPSAHSPSTGSPPSCSVRLEVAQACCRILTSLPPCHSFHRAEEEAAAMRVVTQAQLAKRIKSVLSRDTRRLTVEVVRA
ncbi:hypothetical protein OAO87_04860, partial [bacterium]|nr:hypothetical protein [bacterium]